MLFYIKNKVLYFFAKFYILNIFQEGDRPQLWSNLRGWTTTNHLKKKNKMCYLTNENYGHHFGDDFNMNNES